MTSPAIYTAETTTEAETSLSGALFRFAYSRVRDRHVAEDLTQEILLRAAKKQASVRHPDRISAWLFGIARNVIADYFRRSRPTVRYDDHLHGNGDVEEPAIAAKEEEHLRGELATYVRRIVESLPPSYREAILLTEYEGLSQVELAHRAGISVSAAKSRVQRARQKIRRTIEACCDVQTDIYGTVVDCRPRRKKAE